MALRCARAASGQVAAEAAIDLTKSRRRIASPKAQDYADDEGNHIRVSMPAEWGSAAIVRSSKFRRWTLPMGQERRFPP